MKDAEIQDGIQRSSAQVEVAQVRLDELQVGQVREAFAGPGDETAVVVEADDMDPGIALRKPGSGETVCAAGIQHDCAVLEQQMRRAHCHLVRDGGAHRAQQLLALGFVGDLVVQAIPPGS